eukprot:TRINITY_DN35275_c0_g1_i1.p1 TRINITY_DN35275_c0_g1~~TRINITY_DN35275_c0_g1_i1.p1  ORF type:complete len:713 (+),score=74.09 TRINITY_DN35275_c0_g1_i1:165-2303(+)
MTSGIANGGVRMVLGWLRYGRGPLAPEASDGREDLWKLYVEDEMDMCEAGSRHRQCWCGAWIWSRTCSLGDQCCYKHPIIKMQLCDASVPHIDKVLPLQRLALDSSSAIARERIVFVEHASAGIVWGRMFSASRNEQLLMSYLQSEWAATCFTPHHVEASMIPDACWHRVASAAGIRTALSLQMALGPSIQWAAWLHRMLFPSGAFAHDRKTSESIGVDCAQLGECEMPANMQGSSARSAQSLDHTLVPSNGRSICLECRHWRATDKQQRCSRCQVFLCLYCVRVHICRHVLQSVEDTNDTRVNMAAHQLDSLVGAASNCAAIAGALKAPIQNSRGPTIFPSGVAVLSGLAAKCAEETPALRPRRKVECGSDVLCARFSSSMLAVHTAAHLRVFRRGDWKTLMSSPLKQDRLVMELLEDRSLLVYTTARGLSVLNLEDSVASLAKTEGRERQLHLAGLNLLTGCTASVDLRDLERKDFPIISTWNCKPLGLDGAGAIASVAAWDTSRSLSQDLTWLDLRQKELIPLHFDCSTLTKDPMRWTTAAVGFCNKGPVAVIGTAAGDIVAIELRQPKVPLWCIRNKEHGSVSNIYLSSWLVIAEMTSTTSNHSDEHISQNVCQAVSGCGATLAFMTGTQCFATASGSSEPSQSLLACGVGSALMVVGEKPPATKGSCSSLQSGLDIDMQDASNKKKVGGTRKQGVGAKEHRRRSRPQ